MKGISLVIAVLTVISQVAAAPYDQTLMERQILGAYGDTQNDLTSGNGCKQVLIIFARGTTESGNVGTLVGPPFFSAVASAIGGSANLAVQGVAYPADIPGFVLGGDAGGSTTMANLVNQAATQCPTTKVVMGGYRYNPASRSGRILSKQSTVKVASWSIMQRRPYLSEDLLLLPLVSKPG